MAQVYSTQVLSLVLPGSTYGLSHFLKGEREHLRQVICESPSGVVYTLFAKDIAAHLSYKERLQVIATVAQLESLGCQFFLSHKVWNKTIRRYEVCRC